MGTWHRTVIANDEYLSGNNLMLKVPRGSTLLRVHFGWGFYGDTRTTADLQSVAQNLIVMGIATTVGDGTESPPDARTQSTDQDPPTQRWIYWEARAPRVSTYSNASDLVTWQDSGAQEAVDTKGQVSAKSIPAGDTLNVWAIWAAAQEWDTTGQAQLWFYASLLYQPSAD